MIHFASYPVAGSFDPVVLVGASRPSDVVPREFEANVLYRRELMEWVRGSGYAQDALMDACRRDVVFYANALVWTIDPKRFPGSPVRPWISFPFQEEMFRELEESWGEPGVEGEAQIGHDRCWCKSRDMGASWIPLISGSRRFLCFDGQIVLYVSENEKLVDDRANPNAMFPKIDFIHSRLPEFMLRGVKRHKLKFWRTNAMSLLKGVSTTGIATAGGRPTAIVADEFGLWEVSESIGFIASSGGASNSRLFLGTPKGQGNGFHQVALNANIPRTDIHWTKHPWHSEGLYRFLDAKGTVLELDGSFWKDATFAWLKRKYPLIARKIEADDGALLRKVYPFEEFAKWASLHGKKDGVRSPYYDHECLRMPAWQVAQEQDIDFVGSGRPFYDPGMITGYVARMAREPYLVGDLSYDERTYEPFGFSRNPHGLLSLWMHLSPSGNPPDDRRFVIGADVAAGTGASNSCASVFDAKMREKVASLVTPNMRPERFAELVCVLGRWFGNAVVIFEGQGPGSNFGGRLTDLKYPAIYREENKPGTAIKKPGIFIQGDNKRDILTEYGRALMDGDVAVRDKLALLEGLQFEFGPTGLVEHVASRTSPDPSGAKKNHSDRWSADALGWWKLRTYRVSRELERVSFKEYSYAERMIRETEEEEFSEEYW